MTTSLFRAALLIMASELCLVLSGMLIRQLSLQLPTEMVVFSRNFLGLMLLMPWLWSNGIGAIKTDKLRFHCMRAGVGVTAMYCLYYSWANLPLAEAALLKQTAPFFIPIIALIWLKEQVAVTTRLAILVGFCGVCFVISPSGGTLNTAVIIALFGAMLGGLAKVTIRRMASTEPSPRIVFYFALLTSLISAPAAAMNWHTPDLPTLLLLILMAAFSTAAQLLLSRAYALAPAGRLGPFTYSSVAFAAVLGWLFWGELMELHTLVGVVLIFMAAVISVMKQRRKPLPAC